MNSLSAIQEVWAAIAASPGCCRLLAVSVEVAVLAVAVWCLIRVLRIRSARVCSLLWILVLAKGLFGLAFGAPLEVAALRLTEPARTSQSATAALSAEDLARQEADMQRALREAESAAGASMASAPNGANGTRPASPVAGALGPRRSAPSVLSGLFASIGRFSLAAHAAGLLTAVWLVGVLWALLATALDLRRIRRLARASGAPSAELLAVFRAEAARLGIARVPALSVCAEVESPALAGFLRPTVLAPAWLAETADPGQLRWMLAHELMHYKQKDTVGLLVRRAAQVALWFHPAVWWAGRQWEEAMERACDRALIAGEADARHYAEQLHGVLKSLMARRSRVRVVTGLFATRTQIGKRIAALLTDSLAMPARLSPLSTTLLVLAALASFSLGIGVQRPAAAQAPGAGAPQAKSDASARAQSGIKTTTRTQAPADVKDRKEIEARLAPFFSLYRLEKGEVMRHIAPPFIPERAQALRLNQEYSAEHPGQILFPWALALAGEPPNALFLRWDDKSLDMGGMMRGDEPRVADLLRNVLGFVSNEFEAPRELLGQRIAGDWVIRQGAKPEELVRAFEHILQTELGHDVRFVKRQVQRDVVVASGTFKPDPKAEPRPGGPAVGTSEPLSIRLYLDKADVEQGTGGGTKTEILRTIGDWLHLPVVDESRKSTVSAMCRGYVDASFEKVQGDPSKVRKILDNLTKQTSLMFTVEKRQVDVWFVSEANPLVGLPDAAGAPVAAPAGGPTVPAASPAVPAK